MLFSKNTTTTTIKVNGMMCMMCSKHANEALSKIKGVKKVEVDLQGGKAVITSTKEIGEDELKKAIDEAGYEYAGIVK